MDVKMDTHKDVKLDVAMHDKMNVKLDVSHGRQNGYETEC